MLERKTAVSTSVLEALERSASPLSVSQILRQLHGKALHPNKTTIYRILDKLVSKKVVTEISVKGGASYYEFARKGHHHHFVCDTCDGVFCLEACHVESHRIDLSGLLPDKGFIVRSHDFNLYGTCEPCSVQHQPS